MFENISKGEFEVMQDGAYPTLHGIWTKPQFKDGIPCYVAKMCYAPLSKQNAFFIAYCFNLQQRYDISKLEEAVKLLDKYMNYGTDWQKISECDNECDKLLKEIKK